MNNSISNLRPCTLGENHQNRVEGKLSTSRYAGVSWDKTKRKWVVGITVKGIKKFIGRYDCEEEAANAYISAKREYHKFNPEVRREAK